MPSCQAPSSSPGTQLMGMSLDASASHHPRARETIVTTRMLFRSPFQEEWVISQSIPILWWLLKNTHIRDLWSTKCLKAFNGNSVSMNDLILEICVLWNCGTAVAWLIPTQPLSLSSQSCIWQVFSDPTHPIFLSTPAVCGWWLSYHLVSILWRT